jgi:hypothetical protein
VRRRRLSRSHDHSRRSIVDAGRGAGSHRSIGDDSTYKRGLRSRG